MNSLDEDLLLEYLIENVNKELVRQYPVKAVLAFDYCYKTGENIPGDYLSDIASKIINRGTNLSSKPLKIDESNMMDCSFIKAYESLLSGPVKDLVKIAKTTKDFKGIIIIDLLSKKVSNYQRILSSNNSLDSKVFSLAKAYKDSVLENKFSKDYNKLRELSLVVNTELKKPFDAELANYLQKIRKDLDDKLEIYSKHQGETFIHEIENIVVSMRSSIDYKFRNYLNNINRHYERIKNSFENSVWDNEKRINKLIGLKSELGSVKHSYQTVLFKDGVDSCKDLEYKIQGNIDKHYDIKYTKEEFQSIKTELSDYYPKIDTILSESISPSSITRLNTVYSRLEDLANRKFPNYIPNNQQEDYYSRLDKIMQHIRQKCSERVTYLLYHSTKYRQKIDKAFFSWQTKKFVEELEKYNIELEVWSKCRAI